MALSTTYTKIEIDYKLQELQESISSLGGGGNVDTSNLIPYTGATQNVNIGAYYFESSQGFKKTGGTSNQALTADGGVFDLDKKVDKVAGKQLSTEDYTTTEKNKLAGIQSGAEVNVNADWNATSGDAQILNKPTTFPPSTHTHAVGDITGLQTALDSKQNALTNPVTGTGTTNSLVKFLPDGTVGNSSIFDNETKIGIGLIPVSERLEIDGKVLATGFKTSNGTPTKALTSDGNTFDLNTKADLENGRVPASQLPSYVDDVLEYANLASLPATGESGKIYIAIDTNLTYRWGGSSYVVMTSSLALGETSSTAYRGDRGKIAYDHSQTTGNPHGTTKTDIGLGNVDNTSDLDKPISTATQNALNGKQANLGYTPENIVNKSDSYTASSSTTYASTKALVDGLATKQKKVTVINITGDITLSEIHNGAILHITNSCTLTFAANLGKDFNFVEKAFGSIVVQHVAASGVTLNSDSGLILKNGAMGSVYAPSNNNFILTGTYSTT